MIFTNPLVRRLAQTAWLVQRGVTLGVRIIVIDDERRVLLVRHGYTPGWHFPGGGVDRRETASAAAIRELREETGVLAGSQPAMFGLYTNFAVLSRDHVVVYTLAQFDQGPKPPPRFEIREQGFFPLAALPEATTRGTRARLAELLDGAAKTPAW